MAFQTWKPIRSALHDETRVDIDGSNKPAAEILDGTLSCKITLVLA
jgi:hypothetical protein